MYNKKNAATRKPTFPRFTEMQDCEMTVFANTRKTRAGNIRSFSTSIGSKDSEGNWHNMFIAVRFPRAKVIAEDGRHEQVGWQEAKTKASILAPWMDIEPDASFDGDPLSYLLALAPDATQVGMLSDSWILGGMQ